MVGGNLGKRCVFVPVLVAVLASLEHDTPFVIQIRVRKSICLSSGLHQIHISGHL
jgi:hypothetical protein